MENRGLRYEAYLSDFQISDEQEWSLTTIIGKIQSTVSERLMECGISKENMPLLQALFLGDKSRLDSSLREDFSSCGTVHILAVSGMHVGIIYMFLSFIFRLIFRRSKVGSLLSILGVWCYAIIAGMSPPIFRASIMMTVYELVRYQGRQSNVYDCVWFAMFVILMAQPFSLFTIGFWLSFAAVLGIIALYRPIMELCPFDFCIWRFLYQSTAVTCAAQFATAPFILYAFHTFPTYFVINNLVIVPLASPIIIGALTILIISCVTMVVAQLAGYVIDIILTMVTKYVNFAGHWPYAVIDNISFSVPEMLCLSIVVISVAYLVNWGGGKNFKVVALSITALCLLMSVYEFEARTHTDVILYETYGRLNISINDGGEMRHLQTDVEQNKTATIAHNLERIYRADLQGVDYLYDGTIVRTPYDTLYIVASNEVYEHDVERTIDVFCNDVGNNRSAVGASIITSSVKKIGTYNASNNVYIVNSSRDDVQRGIIIEDGTKKSVSLQD